MKIALLGGTGRTGQHFLALAHQHTITMLSRQPITVPGVEVVIGDATDREALAQVIQDADVIVSALGTDNAQVLTKSTAHLIDLAPQARIITVGTAAILQSRLDPTKLRYEAGDTKRRSTTAAEDHHRMYNQLKNSAMRWTIVCPTYLPEGPVSENYRIEAHYLPTDATQITTGEVAHCLYRVMLEDAYPYQRIGIAQ